MPNYLVVLHSTGEEGNAFFTSHNDIVANKKVEGVFWTNYNEAKKGAMRARLQDTLSRKVTIQEFSA